MPRRIRPNHVDRLLLDLKDYPHVVHHQELDISAEQLEQLNDAQGLRSKVDFGLDMILMELDSESGEELLAKAKEESRDMKLYVAVTFPEENNQPIDMSDNNDASGPGYGGTT